MDTGSKTHKIYRFGVFQADSHVGELTKKGLRVRLQGQPFQLLLLLLEHAGDVVSRETVRQRLWPPNTFVDFDAALNIAAGKLRDALGDSADNPRFVETIPRRGYRFIAPVTTVPPDARPPEAIPDGNPIAPTIATVPRRRVLQAISACVLLVGVGGVLGFRLIHAHSGPASSVNSSGETVRMRRSVAVLGFRNLPGSHDDDWMSQAFSEMLTTELSAGTSLRIVSDEDLARAKRDLGISNQNSFAKETLNKLRLSPGADILVLGSYTTISTKEGKKIRLDLRLQDTGTGALVAENAITGKEEDLFGMISRAGTELRTSLGVYPLDSQGEGMLRASLPSNTDAIRFYADGNAKLLAFDFVGARAALTKAVSADDEYAAAHSALAEALWHLGYRSKASAEAKRAVELSKKMSQEEQLVIAGEYAKTLDDFQGAVKVYSELLSAHRDRLDYGLALASAQLHVNPSEALETLNSLRRLPAPANEDPRIDLLEASAQIGRNLAAAQGAAKLAITKGTAMGSPLLVARAHGILCQQGPTLGKSTDDIVLDCRNAAEAYATAGDHYNEARVMNDAAGIFFSRGDLDEAERMWREAARRFRSLDERQGAAATSNNLGDVLLLRGHLEDARKLLESAIPDYEAIEDISGVALVRNDLGEIWRERGELQEADAQFSLARTLAAEAKDNSALAYALEGSGGVLMDRGDLEGARKLLEESLALRQKIGESQAIAETQIDLAKLYIENGRALDAESMARTCRMQFRIEQQHDDEIVAGLVLTESLLSQQKLDEAEKVLDDLAPLAAKTGNALLVLQNQLVSARVLLAKNKLDLARSGISKVYQSAQQHGFLGVALEAQLAQSEYLSKATHTVQARERLTALREECHRRGFNLIAGKAAELARTS